MKELNHEASEALEGTWYADCRADFDEDSFGGVNVNLKLSGFVYRRVEKSKQALSVKRELVAGQRKVGMYAAHVGCEPDA